MTEAPPRRRVAAPASTETVELDDLAGSLARHLLEPGTWIAERYEIRRGLGSGGYAAVYEAWDHELRRSVALKVLRPERLSERTLRRFRREARVAQELASPRLVRVFDLGRTDDLVYLTMELVRGESLADRLEREGAIEVEEAVQVLGQVLEALGVLHRHGIVHRDVKSSNILLDEEGNVRLADFGLVLPLESDETRATAADTVVGTVEYLSPEQALGEECTPRSDLYSVGVVLFEMLTGRVPHRAGSSLGTLVQLLTRPPARLRSLRPSVPRWLDLVGRRLLERDPARRYATTTEVTSDLARRRLPLWRRIEPLGVSRLTLASTLAIVLLGAAALLAWVASDRMGDRMGGAPSFRLRPIEGGGIRALGPDGEELWRSLEIPNLDAVVEARLEPGGPERLVAVLYDASDPGPEESRTLSILERETGEVLRRVGLPSAADSFPGFSDRFIPRLVTIDLDEDGVDEVLATYLHQPYWPSFTVLWEPRLERARPIFEASGHHYVVDSLDLDHDGVKELLFAGINNRMGWMHALAAVSLDPPVGEPGTGGYAETPDRLSTRRRQLLRWYSLLGLVPCGRFSECFEVDPDRRVLRFGSSDGAVEIDFDGFPIDGPPLESTPTERQQARDRAYDLLREARRLQALDFLEQGLERSASAIDQAMAAGDPILTEWAERTRALHLIAVGRSEEAVSQVESILGHSFDPSEVAFEAARALHLAGELGRAVEWYRRAGGTAGTEEQWGRGRAEILEGLVLALGELGQWQEGLAEIARWERTYLDAIVLGDYYRNYLLWRRGDPPSADLAPHNTDLPRYWRLEFRLASGEPVERLLPEVEAELEVASDTVPMLLSLRAVLLERLGRSEEAELAARRAFERGTSLVASSIPARAHLDLIRSRTADL